MREAAPVAPPPSTAPSGLKAALDLAAVDNDGAAVAVAVGEPVAAVAGTFVAAAADEAAAPVAQQCKEQLVQVPIDGAATEQAAMTVQDEEEAQMQEEQLVDHNAAQEAAELGRYHAEESDLPLVLPASAAAAGEAGVAASVCQQHTLLQGPVGLFEGAAALEETATSVGQCTGAGGVPGQLPVQAAAQPEAGLVGEGQVPVAVDEDVVPVSQPGAAQIVAARVHEGVAAEGEAAAISETEEVQGPASVTAEPTAAVLVVMPEESMLTPLPAAEEVTPAELALVAAAAEHEPAIPDAVPGELAQEHVDDVAAREAAAPDADVQEQGAPHEDVQPVQVPSHVEEPDQSLAAEANAPAQHFGSPISPPVDAADGVWPSATLPKEELRETEVSVREIRNPIA